MSNHTTGPWSSRSAWGTCVTAGEKGSTLIAMCSQPGTPHDEAKANARLIAASPKLLAACELAASWMDDQCSVVVTHADVLGELLAAIKEAKVE